MRPSGDFAIFGSPPAFKQPLHVGRPHMGDREAFLARAARILDSGWVTNHGPVVGEFEAAVAAAVGVRHCVATCNGTVALQLLVRALGLTGEVVVPAFTFVATAHALAWEGVTPRFCDIDERTHNLDPAQVRALMGPHTSGILGVHLWGRPCAVDELSAIAREHGVPLAYDAAQAFGCSHRGRMLGSFGAAEVFSFHATKLVHCFEGGAIVTDDDALAEELQLRRNFGFEDYDKVGALGINAKMTEIAAAMGLESLAAREQVVAANAACLETYRSGLEDLPGIELMAYDEGERSHRHYAVLEVGDGVGLGRDDLHRLLWAENVLARRYFFPGCHRMEPYRTRFADLSLPVTERVAGRVLVLPTGPALERADVERVVDLIRRALAGGHDLWRALRDAAA
jgi:dTDP-4-amino-4,6-dideoxygalactose transaminase